MLDYGNNPLTLSTVVSVASSSDRSELLDLSPSILDTPTL